MLIRLSSKHFLYVPSIVDFDNEQSIPCRIVNNTSIEDNQHVMTDEMDNMLFNQSDHMSENNYPIDLRIASKKTLDSNELPIISKASKSLINMLNSNDLNNQQPVSCDLSQSNFFSSNYTNLSEAQKINSKCSNSIVYTEQSERYYCPKRCKGHLPIISPIRITDDCLKIPMVKFQSRRNCRRRQKHALQKGKHIDTCKSSSTTDLNE
ncbi:unnamed protein product [Rotaria sordida]|uniref:Uncharacterized protein n=1 Tax=Rotaria sordida TaxID=392033 RepID=A0A815UH91_9BILA|nr:unnamed protein product [Rotaria sordida]CAF1513927.1 unnamed protein product [Rotaria sordida]CAF3902018.1 unnamed protein product [Rotaria sordida]CAF4162272.1 unnamed protein product [Rotaria sordida]